MESSRVSEGERTGPEAVPEQRAAAGAPGLVTQVLGLQRTIGNRRTAALMAGGPVRRLSRYEILGPFDKGSAVHETLTLLAVKQAKQRLIDEGKKPGDLLSKFDMGGVPSEGWLAGYDPVYADKSHAQFIRGVVWADDPEGLLFDNPRNTRNYSSGLWWLSNFNAGKGGDLKTLTARSHFGDLQFFHGMASSDAETPGTTKDHMLGWARFLIDVATGRIDASEKLEDVGEVSALFPDDGERTIKELFGWAKASSLQTRQRAVGALFHMVQDSFAHGHVERDRSTGEITEFHAYGSQDEHKHGSYDALGGAWYQTLGERLKQTEGARPAIDHCAEVLEMIALGDSTDQIVSYLDTKVLPLAAGVRPAGPGAGLEKPPPPPPRPEKPEWLKNEPLYLPGKI